MRGGGAERIRLSLAHSFRDRGYDIEFVLTRAEGELLAEAKSTFPVHNLSCSRARNLPTKLAAYLRTKKPDALLAAMWPYTVIAPIAQRLSGHKCTVVISEHAQLSAQYKSWGFIHRIMLRSTSFIAYRLADACVAVSEGVLNDIALLARLSSDKFDVIHNPLALRPPLSPSSLKVANNLWGAKPGARILAVGTIKPQKNFALLMCAFSALRDDSARLMIVGQYDDSVEDLRALADKLNILPQVIFAGYQSNPLPFFATADLFVLSSDYEGFGNVIVEALSQGVPVVSTDCPSGPSEILGNGRWGRLVPVGDSTALAIAIQETLGVSPDREHLKERASFFAIDHASQRYLNLLFPHNSSNA
jgi:glycosyltransferase involved in cell wall biosynthesis